MSIFAIIVLTNHRNICKFKRGEEMLTFDIPENTEINELQKKMNDMINKRNLYLSRQIEELFKNYAVNMITPPIKSDITKGKLKWRGVYLCNKKTHDHDEYWFEQRGRQVSPKIINKITFEVKK